MAEKTDFNGCVGMLIAIAFSLMIWFAIIYVIDNLLSK